MNLIRVNRDYFVDFNDIASITIERPATVILHFRSVAGDCPAGWKHQPHYRLEAEEAQAFMFWLEEILFDGAVNGNIPWLWEHRDEIRAARQKIREQQAVPSPPRSLTEDDAEKLQRALFPAFITTRNKPNKPQ